MSHVLPRLLYILKLITVNTFTSRQVMLQRIACTTNAISDGAVPKRTAAGFAVKNTTAYAIRCII